MKSIHPAVHMSLLSIFYLELSRALNYYIKGPVIKKEIYARLLFATNFIHLFISTCYHLDRRNDD